MMSALGYTLSFDASDPPPCGTGCSQCRKDGHFCPAKGYVGDHAVCRACGDLKPCEHELAIAKLHSLEDAFGEMAVVTTTSEAEKDRCADCRGLLNQQCKGPLCWPCRRRLRTNEARNRRAAEERAARRCA
jgi:hypothetical protein